MNLKQKIRRIKTQTSNLNGIQEIKQKASINLSEATVSELKELKFNDSFFCHSKKNYANQGQHIEISSHLISSVHKI